MVRTARGGASATRRRSAATARSLWSGGSAPGRTPTSELLSLSAGGLAPELAEGGPPVGVQEAAPRAVDEAP